MALAGLELGVRKPTDSIADPGYFTLPNSRHQFRDWKRGGHGSVDLRKSISQSCDVYYYRLAVDMELTACTTIWRSSVSAKIGHRPRG